jgi:DNA-directed RNA polymerase subunit RPC12/RpoP
LSATVGIIIIVIIVVIAILVVFAPRMMARSSRIVPLSHLKCTKCGTEFDYAWIPFVSFTSIRLVKWRYLRCPVCMKWSVFNIWDTRVDPETHHCNIRVGPS